MEDLIPSDHAPDVPRTVHVGDFEVEKDTLEQAENHFESRSKRSQSVDRAFRGPIPADYETWKQNTRIYDFPGVDTPTDNPSFSISDFPSPTDRQQLSRGELQSSDGGIGLADSGGEVSGVLEEHNASMDSLAEAIGGPFTND